MIPSSGSDSRDLPVGDAGRAVLEVLTVSGPQSRAELSRRLSVSATHLTRTVRPLLESGVVREDGPALPAATAGRPSTPLRISEERSHFVGIKLTGDRLYAVRTNMRAIVGDAIEIAIPDAQVEKVVDAIVRAVGILQRGSTVVAGIGISLSGNASRELPMVRTSPFLHWSKVPLATLVSERTGLPTVLENDVRALTAAEHWFGVARDLDNFALLTFGAGIGLGMVTNGHQIEGRLGASGLIGHLPVTEGGPSCYAGHPGCAHAYATIPAVVRRVNSDRGDGFDPVDYDECVRLARLGDDVALNAFEAAGHAIGQLVATTINILGPDRVIIAGEGVDMYSLGEGAAWTRMLELIHWTATVPEIIVQPFEFSEWARGAAATAIQQHIRNLSALSAPGPA